MAENEYEPWVNLGISEVEYWKMRYREARQETEELRQALTYLWHERIDAIGRKVCDVVTEGASLRVEAALATKARDNGTV